MARSGTPMKIKKRTYNWHYITKLDWEQEGQQAGCLLSPPSTFVLSYTSASKASDYTILHVRMASNKNSCSGDHFRPSHRQEANYGKQGSLQLHLGGCGWVNCYDKANYINMKTKKVQWTEFKTAARLEGNNPDQVINPCQIVKGQ